MNAKQRNPAAGWEVVHLARQLAAMTHDHRLRTSLLAVADELEAEAKDCERQQRMGARRG
jgi:hypothetical protein